MFVADGLKADPDNNGWVLGWGVVRTSPGTLSGYMPPGMLPKQKLLSWVLVTMPLTVAIVLEAMIS